MKPGGWRKGELAMISDHNYFHYFVLHPDEGKIPNAFCLLSVICIKVITKTM